MEKYVKLASDIIVPKVWLQSYNREYLEFEVRAMIAKHYLNLPNFPTRVGLLLIPRARLVIVEEKHYFLLDEESEAFKVPESEQRKLWESNRHYREHLWLDIPVNSNSWIDTGNYIPEQAEFTQSERPGYVLIKPRVNIPEKWIWRQGERSYTWSELNLLVSAPIAQFYREANHGLRGRKIQPILLNPAGYLWWNGEEFYFVPEEEYRRYTDYEPTDISSVEFELDCSYHQPELEDNVEVERELMDLEIPRMIQTQEEHQLEKNYMILISNEEREE